MPGRHIAAKRPRSFASIASIAAVLAAVVPWSLAIPAQAAGVPANFFKVQDTDGANDVVGQGDLTQFGRDDTDPTTYKLEWGWDEINWSGANKGDACALFDTDGNGNIDYAICVEVGAGAGATVVLTGGSPTAWTCNDAKSDRCAGPTQVLPTPATAGVLGSNPFAPGDLVTNTDPFAAGTASPKDSTVEVHITKANLPGGAVLTNVCSYPSIGNGGNADPKDCVANPGGGFLVIHKDAGNNTSTVFPFTINPGNISVSSTGTGNAVDANGASSQSLAIGTNAYSFAETLPGGWLFDSASCTLQGGGATGGPITNGVDNITIESGKVTTCNVTDELQHPHITIVKTANQATVPAVGQSIGYTLVATNDGNVPLTNVHIDDTLIANANLTCNPVRGSTLNPTQTMTCTGSHTVVQSDIDAGHVNNTGTATGTPASGPDVTDTDHVSLAAPNTPSIRVVKTANPTTYTAVGDVINYTIVATNNGNVTLTGVTVSDTKVSNLVCVPASPVASLVPGGQVNCTASHTITQADMDAGSYVNTATATGTPPVGANVTDSDPATVTTNQTPAIGITKTPAPLTYSAVGDVINYTIVSTNTGNVTLTNVDVTDPKVSNLVCVPATPVDRAPGQTITCTASHTITQADLDAGKYDNTAHTVGTPPVGANVTADGPATATAVQSPGVSVGKVANPTVFSGSNQTITYTVTATNTGNVTLSNFSITDPLLGGIMTSCTDGGVGVLNPPVSFAPKAVMVCTASYNTTAKDVNAGQIANTATGAGLDPNGQTVSATGSANVAFLAPPPPPVANLGITKTSVPATGSFVQPGDQVVYTLGYTNTGNGAGNTVVVTDTLPADLDYVAGSASNGGTFDAATRTLTWQIGNVAAGGSGSVSFTAEVASTATNGEVLSNVGVITAPGVSLPSNPDDVTVTVPTGALTITKSVNRQSAEFGDTLTYSLLVGATGDIDQTNVTVTDSVPNKSSYVDGSATCDAPCTASESVGVVTWNIGSLPKGTSTVVGFKVTVDTPDSASDGAIPAETIRNVAVAGSDADPGVTSNKVKTDVTAVLGVTHHRKPAVKPVHHDRLPFTGLPYSLAQLLTMAGLAIGAGVLLVHRARNRRVLAAAIQPPTED